jgi:hypothetical protein
VRCIIHKSGLKLQYFKIDTYWIQRRWANSPPNWPNTEMFDRWSCCSCRANCSTCLWTRSNGAFCCCPCTDPLLGASTRLAGKRNKHYFLLLHKAYITSFSVSNTAMKYTLTRQSTRKCEQKKKSNSSVTTHQSLLFPETGIMRNALVSLFSEPVELVIILHK